MVAYIKEYRVAKKTNTDLAVLDLINKVKAKKQEIASASKKPVYQTNVTFGYDPSNASRINIMTVTDPQVLIQIYSFIISRKERYQQAANELGFTDTPTYMGYSFDAWMHDLKARASQLTLDNKKKELERLLERANTLLSPDQRRELELEELLKEVS